MKAYFPHTLKIKFLYREITNSIAGKKTKIVSDKTKYGFTVGFEFGAT